MRDDPFTRLGDSLDRVVGGLGARSSMLQLHQQWPAIVGEAISHRCRPRKLDDGHLVVDVDDPGWATEIRYLERQILAQIAERLSDITVTSISVSVRRKQP